MELFSKNVMVSLFKYELFEDFAGPEWLVGETAASGAVGDFRVIGNGHVDGGDLVFSLLHSNTEPVVQLGHSGEHRCSGGHGI